MPTKPSNEKIEAAAEYLKGNIDPKAVIERVIESDPTVKNFLEERGLITVEREGEHG